MALLGQRNQLRVVRSAPPGFYLDGGPLGEILLPGRYIPPGGKPGDTLDVFIYRDSEDRLVATTSVPHAVVGEWALLRVVDVAPRLGAFLDWGLEKDLLLPLDEQEKPVRRGDWIVVRLALDANTDRLVASTRLARWLDQTPAAYAEDQAVTLLIVEETPLGYTAIVENAHRGLLYRAELAGPLVPGQRLTGYVRKVRPDGKVDVGLDRAGFHRVAPLREQIMEALRAAGGRLPYHDKSSSEEIRTGLGMSKKAFKQAIGSLYRERRIVIEAHGIRVASAAR